MNQGKLVVRDAEVYKPEPENLVNQVPDERIPDWPFSIAGWVKKDKNNKDYYSLVLQKSWKKEDGSYEQASIHLFRDDLLKISVLCQEMYVKTRPRK